MYYRSFLLAFLRFFLLSSAFISLPLSTVAAQDSVISLLKQMIAIAAENGGVGRTEELNILKQRIDAFPKPVRGDKQKARLANDQGLAAYKAGQNEQAKQYFLAAYQADPADAEIAGNLALVYLNLGDSKKALENLTATLALAPGRSSSWVSLASYYALQGQQREAVACYALTYHFSQNQTKTREFLQKLAADTDQPKVQQAVQQALQLSLIQGNSGTVSATPRDSLDTPLPSAPTVSTVQPSALTAPPASTVPPPIAPSSPSTEPIKSSAQSSIPPVAQASIPTVATPTTQADRTVPTSEPQPIAPSTRRGQTQESVDNIGNNSNVKTLIDAKNYIRNIGVDFSKNLISCNGRQQFIFNEWRENFDSALNRGGDREANVRGLDTKVIEFYQKTQSTKISDKEATEGKHYINLLSYIEKKYANILINLLEDKEKFKSECPNLNEAELISKYKEISNLSKSIDQIEANDLARIDNLIKQTVMKAAEAENKKKTDAEESIKKVETAKDRAKKESTENIAKAIEVGPKIAEETGIKWKFIETKDAMTDARMLKSEASFEGESQQVINIEATCSVKSKELSVTATAFDSPSGKGVSFIHSNKKVNLLVRFNNKNPINAIRNLGDYNNHLDLSDLSNAECFDKVSKSPKALIMLTALGPGLVLSGQDPEKLANNMLDTIIAEHPDASCMIIDGNQGWLELSELRVQFPLVHGNVVARIAPYDPNLHRVLEACAEVTNPPKVMSPPPVTGDKPLLNSKLFD